MNIDKEKLTAEVVKYQNGDGNAFEAIYNMTNKAAYFTAMKIVKNEDDAQDVLQDSYVKALEKLTTLDKPDSFMSWFNMIVANNAKNYLAKNRSGRFVDTKVVIDEDEGEEVSIVELIEDKDELFIPEASTENTELCNDVMSLIEGLSDEKRTAVVLYYYNEMTTKQIAESLGVNENTIKSRLVQAKKDLAAGIHALEKKNKSILGIAPMSVVRWALNYNGSDAYQKDLPDFAPLLEKIQGLESHGFSVLEKLKFRVADLFSHFGSGAGAGHDRSAVMKSAAAIVATAGVVGGAVAGTNAIKNRDKTPPAETTTAYVEQVEQLFTAETTIKRSDEDSNFIGETLEVPEGEKVNVRTNLVESRYGVRFMSHDFARNTSGGTDTYYGRPSADRSGFSATYEEMLPYAKQNMQTYSGQISKVTDEVNSFRSGSGLSSLETDDKLAEQAAVRAEEIAWSGKSNSIRPDGSDYTSIFDSNGFTSGTRLEIRAKGRTPEDIYKTISENENIRNSNIKKIGVGVSENPETGMLVFVIHLYSERGSVMDIVGLSDRIENFRNDILNSETNNSYEAVERADEFREAVRDVPVIGPILTTDGPLDAVAMRFYEAFDNWWAQQMEEKELNAD